ncbi:MAG: protein kinase domain-containing protein, partial [Actinomycetota bacterium]
MTAHRKDNGRAGEAIVLGNRYRLETQVATGGMGEVWRATDTLLERTVAVKLLRESLAEDPVLSERFRREALMAARLSHPNMADVFDYVQEDARPGIVMEYVEGETLAERITRGGALPVADAVRITSALLAVLEVAHDEGIVHRDVKPGNIMLPPAEGVKVTDFGIAQARGHETLTETGMVMGTAHYLSPEQVSGKQATPESDIYSAGAILYEMLTGKKPFEAETPLAVAMRRLTDDPVPPRAHRPDLPETIEHIVMRALARDPRQRFRSANAMRSALESAYAAQPPPTPRIDPSPTQVLPVADLPDSSGAPTATIRHAAPTPPHPMLAPEPDPVTGSAPAAAVVRRRRREYRRGLVWLLLIAIGV